MGLCETCGRIVPDSKANCPTCGQASHRAIPCAYCGYPATQGAEWCISCGRYMGKRRGIEYRGTVISSSGATIGTLLLTNDAMPVVSEPRAPSAAVVPSAPILAF